MAPKVERVCPSIELGEGPHWDAVSQCLYYVDIFGKAIHKFIPSTNKHTKATFDQHVSLIVPVQGMKDQFVISLGRDLQLVNWDGKSDKISNMKKLAEVDNTPETVENRLNDGKCDPTGRLWAGTMGAEPVNGQVKQGMGGLFSLEPSNTITKHLGKIGISNGLAWNMDLKKMYYIDSIKGTVDEYDFDAVKGKISNGRTIFTLSKNNINGVPDGMCIDVDGNLWVAVFNGFKVIKIDPRKPETLLETIDIPAKQTTSVAFGGPNMDELYVTSASFTVNGEKLSPPDHGAVFRVTGLGVKGLPGVAIKL